MPDRAAIKALEDALRVVSAAVGDIPNATVVRRIRLALEAHAEAVELVRMQTDPVRLPKVTFDPADPKTIGRMVSLALLAQPRVPLNKVVPSYGSGAGAGGISLSR